MDQAVWVCMYAVWGQATPAAAAAASRQPAAASESAGDVNGTVGAKSFFIFPRRIAYGEDNAFIVIIYRS